jgi:hypothetical protein
MRESYAFKLQTKKPARRDVFSTGQPHEVRKRPVNPMRQKLSLEIETLMELTPDEACAVNGGAFAQPTTTVQRTPPVAQPTTTVQTITKTKTIHIHPTTTVFHHHTHR